MRNRYEKPSLLHVKMKLEENLLENKLLVDSGKRAALIVPNEVAVIDAVEEEGGYDDFGNVDFY